MLFNTIIFGPIKSRRLGISLGINLLPQNGKICSFDCIYCECGLNKDGREDTQMPTRQQVKENLEATLKAYKQADGEPIDTFTFAGNGEPTLHPHFAEIVLDVQKLRNSYYPDAKISVLTNAWQLDKPAVLDGLRLVDNAILKLDSAVPQTLLAMNRPVSPTFSMENLVEQLASFQGRCIIQTMFLRGAGVDNTTPTEIAAWLGALKRIQPSLVQLYSINRKVPIEGLEHVSEEELKTIAAEVKKLGIKTLVTP
ncbi:MAG: radical SAM protein [Paludibacteraceae bacterium]|jgi:wyosine [tRNA(Phe)-imidazoG37] synthetase (radical SAM superfamily)|nr:radical SAM protein [Paludibacteraceae bacterium]